MSCFSFHGMRLTGLSVFAALFAPSLAYAQQDTDTFTVSATVLDSCNVAANDLAFGDYDPIAIAPLDGATTIVVTCTNGTTYEVALDPGIGVGAAVAAREMTSADDDTLIYSLFTDSARNVVWGETEDVDTVDGVGSGVAQTLDVFGRVPPNQTAPAGDYEDTVTVTVSY